jgi:hypothetical protein
VRFKQEEVGRRRTLPLSPCRLREREEDDAVARARRVSETKERRCDAGLGGSRLGWPVTRLTTKRKAAARRLRPDQERRAGPRRKERRPSAQKLRRK